MKDLKIRTKEFSLRIIRMYSALPKSTVGQVIGKQILRSGTSVGAHYREASKARSTAEFVSKLGGAQQELEETAYWLELLSESGTIPSSKLTELQSETDELGKILTTCIKNAKETESNR
jgi:four helix bundle protein